MSESAPQLIFIVGMPRSGTKLLRDLLKNHASIYIPAYETEFFFYWVNRWSSFGDLSKPEVFAEFYRDCLKIPYFMYLEENHELIDAADWHRNCTDFSPSDVFTALIRTQATSKPGASIIGDKSPSYIGKVAELQAHFPEAAFIHIMRDVRDYCLSIHKAWHKNMYRAAWRWGIAINGIMTDPNIDQRQVLHVKYEDLIADPGQVVQSVCDHLQVPFSDAMTTLSKPTENIGDARGATEIKRDNAQKFASHLNATQIKTIESLAYQAMLVADYAPTLATHQTHLTAIKEKLYKLLDGLNLVKAEIPQRGLIGSLNYTFRYHSTTSNNN